MNILFSYRCNATEGFYILMTICNYRGVIAWLLGNVSQSYTLHPYRINRSHVHFDIYRTPRKDTFWSVSTVDAGTVHQTRLWSEEGLVWHWCCQLQKTKPLGYCKLQPEWRRISTQQLRNCGTVAVLFTKLKTKLAGRCVLPAAGVSCRPGEGQ